MKRLAFIIIIIVALAWYFWPDSRKTSPKNAEVDAETDVKPTVIERLGGNISRLPAAGLDYGRSLEDIAERVFQPLQAHISCPMPEINSISQRASTDAGAGLISSAKAASIKRVCDILEHLVRQRETYAAEYIAIQTRDYRSLRGWRGNAEARRHFRQSVLTRWNDILDYHGPLIRSELRTWVDM